MFRRRLATLASRIIGNSGAKNLSHAVTQTRSRIEMTAHGPAVTINQGTDGVDHGERCHPHVVLAIKGTALPGPLQFVGFA